MVSIIIPTYNAERYLAEAIESALNQTCNSKEIIVVDDGSTDKTLQVALRYEHQPSVRIISQSNKGASAARNTGFLASKGDYIQFLDADDILDSHKIQEQLTLTAIYGDDKIYSGRWGLFYNDIKISVFNSNELWSDLQNPLDWLTMAWTKQIWMHPSVWLTPRRLIEKSGLWNESLSLHDDGEFFCRVILQSKGIVFCNNAISYYRKGITNSLSSIISAKAVNSHYSICELYENHLLSRENSSRTRKACATNYVSFNYDYYPGYKKLRKMAIGASERLGGSDIAPSGTDIFFLMKRILGWKVAKRFEGFYYRSGFSLSSLKKFISRSKRQYD